MSNQSPVSWASYKMKAVAASSAESEYMSMSMATREAVWWRALYSDLGYGDLSAPTYGDMCDKDYRKVRLSRRVDPHERAMMLHGDNRAALAMSKNPVLHKRSKHIRIAFHITRQAVKEKVIAPCYIGTNDNIADLMTKELGPKAHLHHTSLLLRRMERGKLFTFSGDRISGVGRQEVRDKLYETEPDGLRRPSELLSDVLKTFTSYFELPSSGAIECGLTSYPKQNTADGAQTCAASAALSQRVNDRVSSALGRMVNGRVQASREFIAALAAIVDSGASNTYCPGDVVLHGSTAGQGFVSTAEGRRMGITERGDLGPLKLSLIHI